jgi:GTP cyclohydrolase II
VSPAERAIRALRRGDPVAVGALAVQSVEVRPAGSGPVLIAWERAAALKLVNQRAAAAAEAAVLVLDVELPLDLADPARDLATPLKGPFRTAPLDHPRDAAAALKLARLAGLLPALRVVARARIAVGVAEIDAWDRPERLREVARARLPVAAGDGELLLFRGADGGPEHLALILGRPVLSGPVLVRLHSSCLTGDVLASLRCDCGPQLHAAMRRLAGDGGVLLYLNQEGRGIGLANKLRAYQLQDQGFDTFEANARLGLPPDARDFGLAAAMLRALGVGRVRLLTNNPAKVERLTTAGIAVVERVPLAVGEGADNAAYLSAKRAAGHWL